MKSKAISNRKILRQEHDSLLAADDVLAVEEPLEICIGVGNDEEPQKKTKHTSISITMRTPGDDPELALGFLYTEGMLSAPQDLISWEHDPHACKEGNENRFLVTYKKGKLPPTDLLKRNFYTSSSCGVCGKASIAALEAVKPPSVAVSDLQFDEQIIRRLPAQLKDDQAVFEQTGGLHAAALFDPAGKLLLLREDVGRHNAVDKLIGASLLNPAIDPASTMLLVSGRASFELVQKALMAGIPLMAAIGAPSSLAVSLAEANKMALIGFLSPKKFNLYCGANRLFSKQVSTS